MMFPKRNYRKVERYRKYVRGLKCIVVGCEKTECQFAHIAYRDTGHCGGKKASDEFSDPICAEHHREQTDWPLGLADWYMVRVNIPRAVKRFNKWESEKDAGL